MIAVTTRSRARSLRHVAPMLVGTKLIERDLATAPGCDRYATVVTGPKEVWTLSIWRDPQEMRSFMRTRTHAGIMWNQPAWLECYWGMRWSPGAAQAGRWEGREWSFPSAASGEDDSAEAPLPALWMEAALGQTVPVERRALAGAIGATYRVKAPPWRVPAALRDLRRLRRWAGADPDALTVSLGLGTRGALCLLVIMGSPEGARRLQEAAAHAHLLERWRELVWWSTWEAESEFGQWKSRRLREGQLHDAPLLLDVALPVHPAAAGEARGALGARLGARDSASLHTLMLVTTELVTNSVRHAGLAANDRIGLQVRSRDDWIRVDVVDRGRRFVPHVPTVRDIEESSGRGLLFLDRMVERWGISQHAAGRRHWFELRVPLEGLGEP